METAIHAERDGKIAEVLVKAGDQVDAKDLLVMFGSVASKCAFGEDEYTYSEIGQRKPGNADIDSPHA